MSDLNEKDLSELSVHERAEYVKTIGLTGSIEELSAMVVLSQEDPSPAVRLRAAEGASHILSRHRIGSARDLLSVGRRRQLLDQFRKVDPLNNPGLFPFLASLDLPRCLSRILVGLRDPRYDVRLGAVLALRRYCCSWSVSGDDRVRRKVTDILTDSRLKPDVVASLAELIGSVGWQESRSHLEKLVGRDDQAGFAAEAAIEILNSLSETTTLNGIWYSNGRDVGEVSDLPSSDAWLCLAGESGFIYVSGEGLRNFTYTALSATQLQLVEGRSKSELSLRRLWVPREGEATAAAVIQAEERSYYPALDEEILAFLDEFKGVKGVRKPQRERMAETLVSVLRVEGEGALIAARVARMAGKPAEAAEFVQTLIDATKKPKIEWVFLRAQALIEAGESKEGKKLLKHFLDKAPKKNEHRPVAEKLLKGG